MDLDLRPERALLMPTIIHLNSHILSVACQKNIWNGKKRQVIKIIPPFPEIEFELGYRNITDMKTQRAIIEKVHELTEDINPIIWFGIDLLATYVNMRPGDLLKIKEKDIDISME